jgi:hypothetical protein
MKQGFLLFAHDNEQISYTQLAVWQSRRIKYWLGKSVSIVTDTKSLVNLKNAGFDPTKEFDQIITSDALTNQKKLYGTKELSFINVDRVQAFDLSPYEETIVIDTDIAIQSDRLNCLWNNSEDLLVCKNSKDIFGRVWSETSHIGESGISFYWATICYFKKTDQTKQFFDICKHIKENYSYYKKEYNIKDLFLRNDHVWSIASHITNPSIIPTNLWFSTDRDRIIDMNETGASVLNEHNDVVKLVGQDFHIMNKFDLYKFVKKELDL